mmetsp:Transcript_29826/g.91321  ORF Transcript_29826/g.91321 Transcript_29826/m.91321 type:complete len:452 (+) Transcript_29826:62-1417(+)
MCARAVGCAPAAARRRRVFRGGRRRGNRRTMIPGEEKRQTRGDGDRSPQEEGEGHNKQRSLLGAVAEVEGLEGGVDEGAGVDGGEFVVEEGGGGGVVDGALEVGGELGALVEDDDVGVEELGGGVEVGVDGVDGGGQRVEGVVGGRGLAEFDEESGAGAAVAGEAAGSQVAREVAEDAVFDGRGLEHFARAEDEHAVDARLEGVEPRLGFDEDVARRVRLLDEQLPVGRPASQRRNDAHGLHVRRLLGLREQLRVQRSLCVVGMSRGLLRQTREDVAAEFGLPVVFQHGQPVGGEFVDDVFFQLRAAHFEALDGPEAREDVAGQLAPDFEHFRQLLGDDGHGLHRGRLERRSGLQEKTQRQRHRRRRGVHEQFRRAHEARGEVVRKAHHVVQGQERQRAVLARDALGALVGPHPRRRREHLPRRPRDRLGRRRRPGREHDHHGIVRRRPQR